MADRALECALLTIGHTIYAFKEGGMERGLLNIINFSRQERFRHVIMCLTEAGEFARQLRPPSCRVIEFRKKPGNDIRLALRIARSARECGVNILHARGWPTLLETAFAARLAGIDATIYGFHGKTASELAGLGMMRRTAQAVALRSYDRVVTLNQRMRADLAAESYLPESRIQVIANGVDLEAFQPREDRAALRARFGLPSNRFIIGNIARLDPVKNHEVIFSALSRFRTRAERPYFVIVGEGEHRTVLERCIRQLDLEEDVRLMGYSNRIAELLNCMDVYVQSSLYEGFSNTILEAMACGLPIVATDVGGTADLFSDGQEGYLFHEKDDRALALALSTLQIDPKKREVMGEAARNRAREEFSIESMVRAYEEMYSSVVSKV
jgi:sugar transferase (PEP-CTERM/EpsH1 system associated)